MTAPVPPVSPEPPRSWFADPRLSLDALTPGQRYTAVLTVVLVIGLLAFGVPRGSRSPVAAPVVQPQSPGGAAVRAGLVRPAVPSTTTTAATPPDLGATTLDATDTVPTTDTTVATVAPAVDEPSTSTSTSSTTTTEPTTTTTAPRSITIPVPVP